ncbi:hypothetical protein L1N85_11840 [Paenibacillus alkaliterrae]|uniref:hypothetical protein n=1 Tax=Paenibacillus alkaliterrae TaxID=320909 RepID=UPI001F4737BC|nr:hypothetical protein [Paenibacillus alkaliterrae]MCF2939128.1 hypothetical protein [Paenibacillus alkaliterrae]
MSEQVNEQELIRHIVQETDADEKLIKLVLKHEQAFISNAKEDKNGEVEIDGDELVDYILSRPDVKSNELTVESIMEAEMDYFMDKGLAGYVD